MSQNLFKLLRALMVSAVMVFAFAAWDAAPSKWGGEATNAYMYNKDKDEPFRFPAGFDPYLNLREKTILQSIRPVTK